MEEREKRKVVKAYLRGYTFEEQVRFLQSKVLMPISVGQDYHEGDKLEATIKLVNRKFGECLVLVADTLQRHTLMIQNPGMSEEEAYKIAYKKGTDWIERNQRQLDLFEIPVKLIRWTDCMGARSQYNEIFTQVKELYECRTDVGVLVKEMADLYITRITASGFPSDEKSCLYSIRYVLEECAVECFMLKHAYHEYIVYPSSPARAIAVITRALLPRCHVNQVRLEIRAKTYDTVSMAC